MADEFSRYHPLVNIMYFGAVLGITMFQMQITLITISLLCGIVYYVYLSRKSSLKYIIVVVVMFLISASINPLFSHRGNTLLFYLFTGNPVTLESIIYGVATAGIISAMLFWFGAFNKIMTSEKFLAGIGKVFPHIATLLTMVFRFVPKFTRQGKAIIQANKALGMKPARWIDKVRSQADIFSITTTWALENSIDSADSMKARGYGTGKRTSYNNYKMQTRDGVVIGVIILLLIIICIATGSGKLYTFYYPVIRSKGSIAVYIMYAILCFLPMIIDIGEAVRWHRLKSRI